MLDSRGVRVKAAIKYKNVRINRMKDDGGLGQDSGGGSGQKQLDSGNVIKVEQPDTDQKFLVIQRKETKLL